MHSEYSGLDNQTDDSLDCKQRAAILHEFGESKQHDKTSVETPTRIQERDAFRFDPFSSPRFSRTIIIAFFAYTERTKNLAFYRES